MTEAPRRCAWVGDDPLYRAYHDEEWGRPVHDGRRLFECLILEGAQAGLSWITILKKRAHYRAVFDDFDPARIACYDQARQAALCQDPGIVRNRAKIAATVGNARAWLALQAEGIDPALWLWSFVGMKPQLHRHATVAEVPATSPEASAMSRALRQRGFTFVGPTLCYAFMQAAGMVCDHTTDCFCHPDRACATPPPRA